MEQDRRVATTIWEREGRQLRFARALAVSALAAADTREAMSVATTCGAHGVAVTC